MLFFSENKNLNSLNLFFCANYHLCKNLSWANLGKCKFLFESFNCTLPFSLTYITENSAQKVISYILFEPLKLRIVVS